MERLRRAARNVAVGMPMGMHYVVRSQYAGEGPMDLRRAKDLLNLGHARENVVSPVPLRGEHGIQLLNKIRVKRRGQFGLNREVASDNVVPHRLVVQIAWLCAHNTTPLSS